MKYEDLDEELVAKLPAVDRKALLHHYAESLVGAGLAEKRGAITVKPELVDFLMNRIAVLKKYEVNTNGP